MSTRLHVVRAGSGDPIVFLHGSGTSAATWERGMDLLADRGWTYDDAWQVPDTDGTEAYAERLVALRDGTYTDFVHDLGTEIHLIGPADAYISGAGLSGPLAVINTGSPRPKLMTS